MILEPGNTMQSNLMLKLEDRNELPSLFQLLDISRLTQALHWSSWTNRNELTLPAPMEKPTATESRLNTWTNSGFRCLIGLFEVQSSRRPEANTHYTNIWMQFKLVRQSMAISALRCIKLNPKQVWKSSALGFYLQLMGKRKIISPHPSLL